MASRSPVGASAVEAARRRAAGSATYRAQKLDRAASTEIAWLVMKHRSEAGLSQRELAERAGMSTSQIARIERGRHDVNIETLRRIARALGKRLVLGFETTDAAGSCRCDLVSL